MSDFVTLAGGGPRDFLTVRHLQAAGTDREIGRVLARAARAAHGADAGPRPVSDARVQRARRRWFAQHHPVLAERVRGIGDVFGVDPGDDHHDLAWLATYDAPAGCSAVFYPAERTKEGHGLLARNFDFPTAGYRQIVGLPAPPDERPLAADPWIVQLRPQGGYASAVVGIMDVMGGMDGVNEAGLAVALLADNESPAPEPSVHPQVGLSEQQIVRYLLDSCATADEAQQALLLAKQYYIFTPCHFLVADRSGTAFIWEYSPGHNIEHIVPATPGTAGALVCTNHLLHRWPDPAQLPDDPLSDGTAAMTYRRWRTLAADVGGGGLVDRDDIRAQFRSVRFEAPVEGARTFWHAIYDVDNPSVEISFYLRDDDGVSQYTQPMRFDVGSSAR
jgi:hypothetical protein